MILPNVSPRPLADAVIAAGVLTLLTGHERPDVTRVTYKFSHLMQVTSG